MGERETAAAPEQAPGQAPGRTSEQVSEPELGLRERKKRETRRRISDIATGLFMMRGFDNVTVADVARNADVSVNTVFNYFKTKEDLFFDRQDEITEQAARALRDRRPGESVVAVFRREFLTGLDHRSYQTAFHEGSEIWAKTVQDSPALTARAREIGLQAQAGVAALLAEETGADPDDITPRITAAMLFSAQWELIDDIQRRKLAGQSLEEMRDTVYANARRVFDLLEKGLGDYAARPADSGPESGPESGSARK
ncbi:TetR/AcrR family transcriptional regulator [Spirillospora sp. NPDC047279]|uniref:TetR/AcrR family transcriptional regulator n=1 Tax=Spirillospora sp. NPDC047279 TaxID=3155478 RepID=UPI0033FB9365